MSSGFVDSTTFKDRVVFWDLDGTLVPYRFKNSVGYPDLIFNGKSSNDIEKSCFLDRHPSRLMQKVLSECNSKKNIIVSQVRNALEMSFKGIWLERYFNNVFSDFIYTCNGESKVVTIIRYCRDNNITLSDISIVDDNHNVLLDAYIKGIDAWPISSFLDWEIG